MAIKKTVTLKSDFRAAKTTIPARSIVTFWSHGDQTKIIFFNKRIFGKRLIANKPTVEFSNIIMKSAVSN